VRIGVIMPAIIDQTGRQFNVDEADGVNRRHRDYWAAMEAGGGLSGATYLALSPDDRQAVRDRVQRSLLSSDSDGPFSVEMEVLLGSGRR